MTSTAAIGDETPSRSQGDAALDAWLHQSLHSAHSVLDGEPLPDCLLRLCDAAASHTTRV